MKKILILSNHFITIYNFRKELINELINKGHKVYISLPSSEQNDYFTKIGCEIIETKVDRRGLNPLKDLSLIVRYIKIMKEIKPDVVFSYTIKPNIYGSIASRITGNKQINNVTGTGATFVNKGLISSIAKALYRMTFVNTYKVFFQNSGDKDFFVKNNMVRNNYSVIPGSGVNLQEFKIEEMDETNGITFIYIGRIMKIKGIEEFLECAKQIKQKYPKVKFLVAGFVEEEKYEEILKDYTSKGYIEYIGFQKDIRRWIKSSTCTILPSHAGEGVPNVLLETSACARICIASDINGSQDVVEHTKTGFLFEAGNVTQLKTQVEKVIQLNLKERRDMGLAGRKRIEENYDRNFVIDRYVKEVDSL
ncbi:glycosyltransferase family 4 protein [Terribacillus saccharophilus]|uniref:glycosyltransferase family 4 protein n=1 Tax=Terribacillus saccharophilus TaxID=361277 RepID=UPI0039826786